jgi:NAD(P)-dependent dehydrogenase (short-subunit alcohol dehydrogenase family)
VPYRDRHVVVTGGTGALGAAVVTALLENGALCHVPYRNEADAARFVHRAHPQVTLYRGVELTAQEDVTLLFDSIPALWASIHIAGGFAAGPLSKSSKTDITAQLESNLVTCFLCCAAAVNALTRSGGGRIVNVAARAALEWRSGAGMAAYTAAKAGVAALTVALAEEVAKDAILVNAVAPSVMDTPANRRAMPGADHAAWP